jgi:hypothetical protein
MKVDENVEDVVSKFSLENCIEILCHYYYFIELEDSKSKKLEKILKEKINKLL